MKKFSKILLTVFSVGTIVTLFAGALAFLGYVAAIMIGGETATNLCVFIHKQYFPWIIRLCSIAVAFGLFGMYFEKKRALSMDDNSDKK